MVDKMWKAFKINLCWRQWRT